MEKTGALSGWKDSVLFTPGPLTTSRTVKLAMLRDYGSRDNDFINIIRDIRSRLVCQVAGLNPEVFTSVLMQGCGSMGVESVISSVIPQMGSLLIINNGAYGLRMMQMARTLNIKTIELSYREDQIPDVNEIDQCLADNPELTHIAMVHCETTSGIMNPIQQVGQICIKHNVSYIVDAMSSFGADDIDMELFNIDYLISSANKCIEGVPGFSFILARTEKLLQTKGYARSLCFDLYDQYIDLENHGYFRYTPAVQTLLAFQQALIELEAEGGVPARCLRYKNNHKLLLDGMDKMGFKPVVNSEFQGHIITSFYYLDDKKFDFDKLYNRLHKLGFVIYQGKLTNTDCFRIANIGRVFESDVMVLLMAIRNVLQQMNVSFNASKAALFRIEQNNLTTSKRIKNVIESKIK